MVLYLFRYKQNFICLCKEREICAWRTYVEQWKFYQILSKNLKTNCVRKKRTKVSSHSENTACSDWDDKNECHSADAECPDGKDKKLKTLSGHMRRTKRNSRSESPFSEESLITVVSTYLTPILMIFWPREPSPLIH